MQEEITTDSKLWTLLGSDVSKPEFLPYALHSVSADDEHLRHVVCQHLAGVTDVYSRLWVNGNHIDLLQHHVPLNKV